MQETVRQRSAAKKWTKMIRKAREVSNLTSAANLHKHFASDRWKEGLYIKVLKTDGHEIALVRKEKNNKMFELKDKRGLMDLEIRRIFSKKEAAVICAEMKAERFDYILHYSIQHRRFQQSNRGVILYWEGDHVV